MNYTKRLYVQQFFNSPTLFWINHKSVLWSSQFTICSMLKKSIQAAQVNIKILKLFTKFLQ